VDGLERKIMELKEEFIGAKQEQYRLKSEKNAVELATR
jgi:Arc/MetJ family transcription regulator